MVYLIHESFQLLFAFSLMISETCTDLVCGHVQSHSAKCLSGWTLLTKMTRIHISRVKFKSVNRQVHIWEKKMWEILQLPCSYSGQLSRPKNECFSPPFCQGTKSQSRAEALLDSICVYKTLDKLCNQDCTNCRAREAPNEMKVLLKVP